MMYRKTVLENGVRILSERMDHFCSVSMGIWVGVGSRDEVEKENGISHFIEHMIFKGTRSRSSLQIAASYGSSSLSGHVSEGAAPPWEAQPSWWEAQRPGALFLRPGARASVRELSGAGPAAPSLGPTVARRPPAAPGVDVG